jgi:hypothetical protein
MNQSHGPSEELLTAVARAARAAYARRERADLSNAVFAELDTRELERLTEQVLERLPQPSVVESRAHRSGSRWRIWLGPAAAAAGVIAFGLWWRSGGTESAGRIAKEPRSRAAPTMSTAQELPTAPELSTAPMSDVPAQVVGSSAGWLPEERGWLCTDSAFVDTGRVDASTADTAEVEAPDPVRAPLLWLRVNPGYADRDATLLNRMDAAPFRARRLRLQARIQVAEVVGAASLWLRVDGAEQLTLARGRSRQGLSGTRDFEQVEVTVDVPPEAETIVFGASLSGTGELWLDAVRLDIAPASSAEAPTSAAAAPAARGLLRKRPLRPVP